MAKKKATQKKAKSNAELIALRPGQELGELIGSFSDEAEISRGEAVKRMASLALRGLDVGFYGYVEQLSEYLYYGTTFDESCHHIAVAIQNLSGDSRDDVLALDRDLKIDAVRQLITQYEVLRQHEENAEQERIHVRVFRKSD